MLRMTLSATCLTKISVRDRGSDYSCCDTVALTIPHTGVSTSTSMVYVVLILHTKTHDMYLGNTVTVPQDDTDLRGSQPLLGQLVDLVLDLVRGQLQPLGHRASVWERRLGDSLAGSVHTTHREI